MFDIGWSELFIVVVVTLIVLGPRELPHVLYQIGKFIRYVRSVTRGFQGHFDRMIHEAELEDMKKNIQDLYSRNLTHEMEKFIDPSPRHPPPTSPSSSDRIDSIDSIVSDSQSRLNTPTSPIISHGPTSAQPSNEQLSHCPDPSSREPS